MNRIEFGDNENTYGVIETEVETFRIVRLMRNYIKSDEEGYNMDDFFDYLKKRKVAFKDITPRDRVLFEL